MANKQPVVYMQIDPKWKKLPYRIPGETATIGGSGCGPSSACMAIESITGQKFNPVDACKWSVDHGYKALNAGTYFSYFVPQFKAFGIDCVQLSAKRFSNDPGNTIHDYVKEQISEGYYAIALMGPGLWTSGGHYILVWDWDDKVRINDPASYKEARWNGDPDRFRRECRNYWLIDARRFNDDMTYETWKGYMDRYLSDTAKLTADPYAESSIEKCIDAGIFQNAGIEGEKMIDRPRSFTTRQDLAVVANKLAERISGAK